MEVIEDVEQSLAYIVRKTNFILEKHSIPKNSHNWADYEYGKDLLEDYGLFSYLAIMMLAAWVGV